MMSPAQEAATQVTVPCKTRGNIWKLQSLTSMKALKCVVRKREAYSMTFLQNPLLTVTELMSAVCPTEGH